MADNEELKIPSLKDLVKKVEELQMLPQVARKVMEMVNQDSVGAGQLAEVLEKDPNVTTRILKIANSAFYGLRREVTTVQQAIMILGFKALRSMVIASSTKSMHKRFGITEQLMWDQSIGTAIGAKLIARGQEAGELAFVGGLLHNVGQSVMNNECPKGYVEVMKLIYNDEMDTLSAEKEVFGYTYPEVGFELTEQWGLPERVGKIIRNHKLSRVSNEDQTTLFEDEDLKQALAAVEIATEACRRLGIGYRDAKTELDLTKLRGAEVLNLEEEELSAVLEKIEAAVNEEKSVFQ